MEREPEDEVEVALEQDDLTTQSSSPAVLRLMGRLFRLRRREVVSRSGERTRLRLTYESADLAAEHELEDHGRRGGPDDQPLPTGGDGFQAEPPTPRD